MDSLGSTAGLLEGRRGSVLGMHPTVMPSVHIVNPTLTTATAPFPPSMTVPSSVTHRSNTCQKSSPLILADSAKQSSVSASNFAPKITNPTASANAAGAVAAVASGSTMSGPGSVGNLELLLARVDGPSVHVVPSQNTRGHSGSASIDEPAANFAASVRQLGSRCTSECPLSFS